MSPRHADAAKALGDATDRQSCRPSFIGRPALRTHSCAKLLPVHSTIQGRFPLVPSVKVPLLENSCKPQPDHAVTLTTQISLDRFPKWSQQAREWAGPVSVAVYIPAPKGHAAANMAEDVLMRQAVKFCQRHADQPVVLCALYANHNAREGSSCIPLESFHAEQQPSYDQLYPINALRNAAIEQAVTPFVLLTDADFIPSTGLFQDLHTPGSWVSTMLL